MKLKFFILLLILPIVARADDKKLLIPRFVTIKSNEVNARVGPGKEFPVEWIFIKKGEPVEIYKEYEQWRQIRDIHGEGGWVHVSVLSNKRNVIVMAKEVVPFTIKPVANSKVVAKLSPGLRCQLIRCRQSHCQLKCSNYKGWVSKKAIWGVYDQEEF